MIPRPLGTLSVMVSAMTIVFLTAAAPAVGNTEAMNPAGQEAPLLCEDAARQAAQQEGVPLSVLTAISLNESGRKQGGRFRAWPWTVNMEGAGHWFNNRDEALRFALAEFDRGARSFDVGCFQINYKWHGENFTSIEEMFDPIANARYAARFLRTLYAEQGSWEGAAGAYHSRTPEFADRYAARFVKFRNNLLNATGSEIPEIPDIVLAAYGDAAEAPRVNNYPLLQRGSGAALGSLVPVGNGSGAMLFGSPAPDAMVESDE